MCVMETQYNECDQREPYPTEYRYNFPPDFALFKHTQIISRYVLFCQVLVFPERNLCVDLAHNVEDDRDDDEERGTSYRERSESCEILENER